MIASSLVIDGSNRKASVRWILMRLDSCFIGFN